MIERIKGHIIDLRPVELDDAGFIHELRSDPNRAKHLNPIKGTVADQRNWLLGYKQREVAKQEMYFVVLRKSGNPCGLVRLYDIQPPRFTWGSIIFVEDRPKLAALEATVLSIGFGFEKLACSRVELDVRRENTVAIAFYQRFGFHLTGQDEASLYFTLEKPEFDRLSDRHRTFISQGAVEH
ncbi:MAG: GNAT family N-acetyltransferase [Pseudomonadota bacterium]